MFQILKEVVNEGNRTDLTAGLEMERYAWSLAFATEDLTEGVEAFLEKRDPEYEGR
jgi:enoyl-CoA hydratase/carnithine racemase